MQLHIEYMSINSNTYDDMYQRYTKQDTKTCFLYRTHARVHTRTRTHARSRASARTRTLTCTRPRPRTHARTQTHAHTHTRTHTPLLLMAFLEWSAAHDLTALERQAGYMARTRQGATAVRVEVPLQERSREAASLK